MDSFGSPRSSAPLVARPHGRGVGRVKRRRAPIQLETEEVDVFASGAQSWSPTCTNW